MDGRGWELITSDEPTILTKPLFDALVMKSCQNDRCLADSAGTNKGYWSQVFRETNDRLDKVVTSETSPRRRGR